MTKYSEQSRKKKIRYIVLRKNRPVLEVSPINEKDYAYLRLKKEFDEAEKQIKNGDYLAHQEMRQELGLN